MEAVRAVEGADDRFPARAVGVDAPDAPVDAAAQPLRLQRAEDDSAIGEHDRVQSAADVEMADLLDVAAVLVHDIELERILRIASRRLDPIAVTGEDDLAARQRAGA